MTETTDLIARLEDATEPALEISGVKFFVNEAIPPGVVFIYQDGKPVGLILTESSNGTGKADD